VVLDRFTTASPHPIDAATTRGGRARPVTASLKGLKSLNSLKSIKRLKSLRSIKNLRSSESAM
jgi:hypothetical protein